MNGYTQRVALAALIAFSLLVCGAIAVPVRAHAASGGPEIVFTAPIYAGQNNGNAEGPVGATVSVQGSGWAATSADVQVTLADEQNDTSGLPGSACQNGGPKLSIPGLAPQPPDGSGGFSASFVWPASASAVGHSYWVCGQQDGTTSPGANTFTVLSSNPPSLTVSNDSLASPGGSITVTGQNWLPGNQQINVIVTPCLQCTPSYQSETATTSAANGSISVSAFVPTEAKIGDQLYIIATSQSSSPSLPPALAVNDPSNAPRFTVVASATPTPTPTTTPSPTPTIGSTATATSAAASGTGGGNNTNTSSGNTLLIIVLAALVVVLLIAALIAALLVLRSRGPASAAPGKGGPPYRGGGDYGPPRGQYGGPRRAGGPYDPPAYPDTNAEYYDRPPPRRTGPRSGPSGQGWGNAGGWQGTPQEPGPDDGSGDDPTIGMSNPWR